MLHFLFVPIVPIFLTKNYLCAVIFILFEFHHFIFLKYFQIKKKSIFRVHQYLCIFCIQSQKYVRLYLRDCEQNNVMCSNGTKYDFCFCNKTKRAPSVKNQKKLCKQTVLRFFMHKIHSSNYFFINLNLIYFVSNYIQSSIGKL